MSQQTKTAERWRTTLLWLTGARLALGALAFPLAPFLYERHYLVLVLLRPTRLVLFFGGVLVAQDKTDAVTLIAAALPLALLGVWQAYAMGLANARRMKSDRIPERWRRFLPAKRLDRLRKALKDQGVKLVLLTRISFVPRYLVGAAAGSSDMEPRRFLVADGAGTALEIGLSLLLGYLAGSSDGAAVVVAIGIAALIAASVVYGRQFRRE